MTHLLSFTPHTRVPPLPSLAGTSCSISEAQCELMGLTFLVKSQGKSWKCPDPGALFLASWSPPRTVLSAREAQSSRWVTGLEAGPDPRNICLCAVLRASQAAVSVGQPPGTCLGRTQEVWGWYGVSGGKSLCHSCFLHSQKYPQGPGSVVLQTYFQGLENIFQVKLYAVPDTQNWRRPVLGQSPVSDCHFASWCGCSFNSPTATLYG